MSTGVMTSLPTGSDRSLATIFLRLARDPNHIISAFDGFSCKRLEAHQSPTALTVAHQCKRSMVDGTLEI